MFKSQILCSRHFAILSKLDGWSLSVPNYHTETVPVSAIKQGLKRRQMSEARQCLRGEAWGEVGLWPVLLSTNTCSPVDKLTCRSADRFATVNT